MPLFDRTLRDKISLTLQLKKVAVFSDSDDLFTRKIVGHSMHESMPCELAINALDMRISHNKANVKLSSQDDSDKTSMPSFSSERLRL